MTLLRTWNYNNKGVEDLIDLSDIQAAVAAKLVQSGHTVTANEVQQGFNKPTFFIDVLPVSTVGQGKYYEFVTVSAEITYHPSIETREHILGIADGLKELFLYQPVAVKDRFLSADEIIFDADKGVLTAYFELAFMQEKSITEPQLPKMETIRTEVRASGTASNTDTV